MGESILFQPQQGGLGARLACSTSSATVQVPITRTPNVLHVAVSNSGSVSAFVRFGTDSNVVATTACYEIMPGVKEILMPPAFTISLYVAAITESGTTSISVCAGRGA